MKNKRRLASVASSGWRQPMVGRRELTVADRWASDSVAVAEPGSDGVPDGAGQEAAQGEQGTYSPPHLSAAQAGTGLVT